MTLLINALDNQFAAATDGNVNSGPGTSTFDYPPNSTSGLVIESQPGDPSPYIFSPGDTYTISFSGNGGTTLQDAVVIRSDFIDIGGDTGYAVVFEGLDDKGDLVQVVWTPDFDLEGWYWDNFSGGNPPGFYNSDLSAATTYAAPCFTPGVRVLTDKGPVAAGDLRAGDKVMTLDGGAQPILRALRVSVPGQRRGAPIWMETGVIGNTAPLLVSQQHRFLIRAPEAARFGGPEVLIPALALFNGATVRLAPAPRVDYIHLLLEQHHILRAEGAETESLFLGPMMRRALARADLSARERNCARKPARPLLTLRKSLELLETIRKSQGVQQPTFGRRGLKHSRPYVLPQGAEGRAYRALRDATASAPAPLQAVP